MHLQGSKQVASPEAVLFPRPPFMCFMQTFSKCTTISCISRDKTNGFSFSYEGVVEGRSRESTGKAFAAPVDRPPLSLTHHLTPQMCPLSTSQGGNLAIFGSKYKSFLPVVLRIRKMWILAAPVDILTHHLTPQMCPLQHPKTKVTRELWVRLLPFWRIWMIRTTILLELVWALMGRQSPLKENLARRRSLQLGLWRRRQRGRRSGESERYLALSVSPSHFLYFYCFTSELTNRQSR